MALRGSPLLRRLAAALALGLATPALAGEASFSNPPAELRQEVRALPALPEGWTAVGGPGVTVHGHVDDLVLLRTLSRHADDAVPRLARALGVPIGGDVAVVVARTADEFARLQPGDPPLWADATAYATAGTIFLRHPDLRDATDRPLEQVLDHELVHVLLGRAFAPVEVPHWLQEGVAQVYSGEIGLDLPERLSRGALGTGLFSLQELEDGFPQDPHRAALAYAQSADFVQWFRAGYGDDAVQQLVRQAREGRSLAVAVHRITGQPLPAIDAAWRERLVATTSVFTAPQNLEAFLWGGAGLAIVGLGWGRRREVGRRLDDWRTRDAALARLAREVLIARHVAKGPHGA